MKIIIVKKSELTKSLIINNEVICNNERIVYEDGLYKRKKVMTAGEYACYETLKELKFYL